MNHKSNLISGIVDPGYCIGCGICTRASMDLSMAMNKDGLFKPVLSSGNQLSEEEDQKALSLCPFSGSSKNEDEICNLIFEPSLERAPVAGPHISCFIARVTESDFSLNGTSSGFTSWILCQLLKLNLIDAVIHVCGSGDMSTSTVEPFGYAISSSVEEVMKNAKTKYYPVELSKVLAHIEQDHLRYALVGLPCFIKGVNNLRLSDPAWLKKIRFTVSLFCGHLKSALFTENLVDSAGIKTDNVNSFNYRYKSPDLPANAYVSRIGLIGGLSHFVNMSKVRGGTWNTGAFKYYACNFCDDILGETADISIGDAWMPEFRSYWKGTNNIIIRNELINDIVVRGLKNSRLWGKPINVHQATYGASKGGIVDRREGLSYRLSLLNSTKAPCPVKRVSSSISHSRLRKETYALKVFIGIISPKLFRLSKKLNNRLLFVIPLLFLEACYKRKEVRIVLYLPIFSLIVRLLVLAELAGK
jgi:coenzyme F420 hydrogenase subunit beta